jgi:hypothetical protein
MLSLACPGLGLGSDYGYIIYAYVTLSLLRLFWSCMENRIWGDGIGNLSV